MVKKAAKKVKKKVVPPPSEKELRVLAKQSLGENAQINFYCAGRLYVFNERDLSLEIESTSNAEVNRLAKVVLDAVGEYRRNAKTGRIS